MTTQATHTARAWAATVDVHQSGDSEYIDAAIWLTRAGNEEAYKQLVTLVREDAHIYCGDILYSENAGCGYDEINGKPPEDVAKALGEAMPAAEALVRRLYAEGRAGE